MSIRMATLTDAPALAALEQSQLQDELSVEQRGNNLDGQSFSQTDITSLIKQHWIAVAELNNQIVGYVFAGRWTFFKQWPIYRHLLKRLPKIDYERAKLTETNTCQYGPIWIAAAYRGQGIFEALVKRIKKEVANDLPYMLTFIAEDNAGSFAAHTRKAQMQVVDFVSFDERDYYLLVMPTTDSYF
ncbi:GNAT family N-acetyltransferase [Shewanella youngdeokensis]|uniref:GNAT family N-acetyltransferase n=1 Tax=Shewanella youngdeokensis TaxID=2999068 RepID=UPI0035C032D0